jgi:hypothetical protein
MIADLSIHNVEEVQIGPVSGGTQNLDVHREIKIYTKGGMITLTLWGRANQMDEEHTTLDITL